MRFSKPKQFWEWFRRNQETYLHLFKSSKAEALYLMREMTMHLAAYGTRINAELYWEKVEGDIEVVLVFTTYGRARQFRKVERLVAQAPDLPGWRFLDLDPPRPIDFFLDEDYGHLDFDPFNLWFEPPRFFNNQDKCCLDVYVDTYTQISKEYEQAVAGAVYNVLGEKVYGLKIRELNVDRLCELPKRQRSALVNLQQLPQYIQIRDDSCLYVNEWGQVKKQQ